MITTDSSHKRKTQKKRPSAVVVNSDGSGRKGIKISSNERTWLVEILKTNSFASKSDWDKVAIKLNRKIRENGGDQDRAFLGESLKGIYHRLQSQKTGRKKTGNVQPTQEEAKLEKDLKELNDIDVSRNMTGFQTSAPTPVPMIVHPDDSDSDSEVKGDSAPVLMPPSDAGSIVSSASSSPSPSPSPSSSARRGPVITEVQVPPPYRRQSRNSGQQQGLNIMKETLEAFKSDGGTGSGNLLLLQQQITTLQQQNLQLFQRVAVLEQRLSSVTSSSTPLLM